VVGRGDFADAYVEDDALSRSHFLIVCEGPDYVLVDLNSANGTSVDGKRVSACILHSNTRITAGASAFFFSLSPVAADALAAMTPSPKVADPAPLRPDPP
jgi:pSer/pThr/pTyr-binding forkhead associated (FHA) protein